MIPFNYPDSPHLRKHGPAGYAEYNQYRDWLRDEFLFRCVYCLQREPWGKRKSQYHIDHFEPQTDSPGLKLDYDNLLYCCSTCNQAKRASHVPNPETEFTSDAIDVFEDGTIQARTPGAARIVEKLGLNSDDYNEFRMTYIGIVRMAASDPEDFLMLMRYPTVLPNLASKEPPDGNSRPEGVEQSCYARRERGELPDVYL